MTTPPGPASVQLARQAREQFVTHMEGCLAPLCDAIRGHLADQIDAAPSGQRQEMREGLQAFDIGRAVWVDGVRRAWRRALQPPTATTRSRLEMSNLQLMGDDVVENKIIASRLAMAIQEKASWDLNELKLRIEHLEATQDLAPEDVLRPEAIAQLTVEQWSKAELSRDTWTAAKEVLQQHLTQRAVEGYRQVNEFLVDRGILPEVDLAGRLKRSPGTRTAGGPPSAEAPPEGGGQSGAAGTSGGGASGGGGGGGGARGNASSYGAPTGVTDETRMMTSSTPLARARARATGVLGQLRRLIADKVGPGSGPPTPGLTEAITQHATGVQTHVQTRMSEAMASGGSEIIVFDDAAVHQVAQDLRQRTVELKKKAGNTNEKATIEIVALMFQSILSEERIPAAIRVWFARLQMPVLRVAIAEPEFFGSLEHPARQLIDRMGSCVLGFDAAAISGSAMEAEIKRVVQVIEQYPETGRRVFQLVYEEFQRFLSKFLTEKEGTQRLVSVAQQVEQKETMAIQYTIELRKMLSDVPVRDEIREFLFKVWAEVLAVAAVKHGPQHEETVALKKSAADLVWAASAKPNRNERAKVINDLPGLLVRLRRGMTLMGVQGPAQEAHIKVIGDTLADAFLSKTEAISHERIDEIARRLANLEDFVSDDAGAELQLDKDSIELMLGIDASMIDVISTGGSQPSAAMLGWAQELQPGTWFNLDHNGNVTHVQYAWRSDRGQLHLFASSDGRSYLVQLRRLAAYLQAGLLVPTEEEALTVRATREALAKLDANPERLLQ